MAWTGQDRVSLLSCVPCTKCQDNKTDQSSGHCERVSDHQKLINLIIDSNLQWPLIIIAVDSI